MRSTRQLLQTQFALSNGPHEDQLHNIEKLSGKPIVIPELYLDRIYETTMDIPYNIQLKGSSDHYYVDSNTLDKITKTKGASIHPLDNLPHNFQEYQPDTDLSSRIATFVTIHAINLHLTLIEAARQESLLNALDDLSNEEVNMLLAFHSADMLNAISFPMEAVPAHFFSSSPGTRLMTVPVTLDDRFQIDFFELLELQPKTPSDTDGVEFLHPHTGKPIRSISINYQLLTELDHFLENSLLEKSLLPIKQMIIHNNAVIRRHVPRHAKKSFAQILEDEKFPREKIPESLMVGFVPLENTTMITTHPVILDGACTIDFDVLMKFWTTNSSTFWGPKISNWGINPLTGKKVKTMEYDEKLKNDTDKFILNLTYYAQTITPEQAQDSSYLRRPPQMAFHTMKSSIWIQRGTTQKPGLSKLAELIYHDEKEKVPESPESPESSPRTRQKH